MCGRFLNLNKSNFIKKIFDISRSINQEIISYNLSPSQIIQIITNHNNNIKLEKSKWGYSFIDKKINSEKIIINSRLETIREKLLFKDSFQKRKCIIPANGYYEWSINQNIKIPYLIHLPKLEPIFFAGIWKFIDFKKSSNKIFSIITKSSNSYISNIHNRMPVIFSKNEALSFLDHDNNNFLNINFTSEVEDYLEYYKLNKFVNNPNNNSDKCIEPLC